MLKRLVALVLLTVAVGAADAAARDAAKLLERRVRAIETRTIGAGHAAEHAYQRHLRRTALRRGRKGRAAPSARLRPNNALVPARVGGHWARGIKLPVVAINATLMHTGKVLIFAYPWRPGRPDPRRGQAGKSLRDPDYSTAYVFDPETGRSREVPPPINPDTGKPANIFCAGTSLLPDGDVLVVGGDVGDPTAAQNKGLNTVYTFDPDTERWTDRGRTRQGRWYPTQLEMADGRTLILAGLPNGDNEGKPDDPDWQYKINGDVEIYSPEGTLTYLQNFRVDEPADGTRPPAPGQYPHMWWMPSGRALMAGPRTADTWAFYPAAPGVDSGTWADLPNLPTHRQWAVGTLQPGSAERGSTSVMLFGGADRDDRDPGGEGTRFPAVRSTTSYDEADPDAGWVDGPDMKVARAFANGVLLPDGRTAVVGGGTGEDAALDLYRWQYTDRQRRVELYDPERERFTLGNAQAEGRTYHSTAVLLPDGRVLSAGDDINGPEGPDSGVVTDTAEIWSPPYLFGRRDREVSDRPVIRRLPTSAVYGKPFAVGTTDKDIRSAVLVAPGAATHDTDMNQRVVRLAKPVRVKGQGYNLIAPAGPNLAPPGYYMLFLLDRRGVPSEARFIRLRADGTTPVGYPAGPLGPGPPPTSGMPAPAPAEPGGESPPPEGQPPAAEATPTPAGTVPFRVTLRAQAPRLRALRRDGALDVSIRVPRAGSVRVSGALEGRPRPGTIPLREVAPATQIDFGKPNTATARLELSAAGRRILRRAEPGATLRLTAEGTPAYGPVVHANLRLTLR